jgi:hypothetical protein
MNSSAEAALERARKEHAEMAEQQIHNRLQAFVQLKAALALDKRKAEEWKAVARDSRR